MLKGILIDLDNTLYEYDVCHEYALDVAVQKISSITNQKTDEIRLQYDQAKNLVKKTLKKTQSQGIASSHNRLLYFQKYFETIGLTPIPVALELYHLYWNSYLEKAVLFDGVIDFFEETKKRGLKVVVVTDLTADVQHQKIEKLGLGKYLDLIVTSEEAGVEKPNLEIFQLALEKAELLASEVCMIGDNYKKDIEGAVSANIRAYYITSESREESEGVVSFTDFNQLAKLIFKN
ncbi:MAG: HAD family hydrolase [Bacteriovoracaceae bacterium]|jgi:HAD superfamily hydrolase (TIGR01549 family)|nr:HAD family hydrolase [Bacteriovoracaceae bacterium]